MKIMIIDDDHRLVMNYYEHILRRQGYDLYRRSDGDEAFDFAHNESSDVDLIILDIMMPPRASYKNRETHEGLRTGVFVYDDIRKQNQAIPIIVLTNVENREVLEYFREVGDQHLVVRHKKNTPPLTLAELVADLLNTRTDRINKSGSEEAESNE